MKLLHKFAFLSVIGCAVAVASGCQKNASDTEPKSGANNPPAAASSSQQPESGGQNMGQQGSTENK